MDDPTALILWLAAACAISFLINLVPAFMPSTWLVMAVFYIQGDAPFLPLVLVGTLAAAAGRLCLARASGGLHRRVKPDHRTDIEDLGDFLNEQQHWLAPIVFVYALTPLPTNNLFIAAGLADVRMTPVVLGFTGSRLLANAFWIWTADRTVDNLSHVFRQAVSPLGLAIQLLGLGSVVALYFVPWGSVLRRITQQHR